MLLAGRDGRETLAGRPPAKGAGGGGMLPARRDAGDDDRKLVGRPPVMDASSCGVDTGEEASPRHS